MKPETKILTQVRFKNGFGSAAMFGGCTDPTTVGLQKDVLYDVTSIEVHSFHTKITLHGIEGKFNSVLFDWLDESVLDQACAEWRLSRQPAPTSALDPIGV